MWPRAPGQGLLPVIRRLLRGSGWRREVLRANLWLVPAVEVVVAVVLFAMTYALDRAAFAGDFGLPGWVLSGSPDAARQILIAIAAAVITVVGVVFSMVIVALTLASGQFGPLMLRNFIRDRGTQVTLGTFVATFVYAVLALGASGQGGPGFVPHVSVSVTLALTVADLAVLIYFLGHITTQIQLPQVIARIAGDLAEAPLSRAGHAYATVWPADAAERVSQVLSRTQVIGPYRALAQDVSFGIDQLAEIAIRALSPAVNDTFTALACIDWIGDSLCKVTGRCARNPTGLTSSAPTRPCFASTVGSPDPDSATRRL